jgi:hypothetical protein
VTAAGEVLAVHRATVDQPCRRCGETIEPGRRLAVVAGVGRVHLACLITREGQAATTADQQRAAPVAEGPSVADPGGGSAADPTDPWGDIADDRGPDATNPPDATRYRPVADDDDRDPRRTPWWQR